MPDKPSRRDSSGREGIAAFGVAVLAIGCCAGVPLIAALAGSVAVGTVLGIGAGIVVAIIFGAAVVLRVRARRRACEPPAPARAATAPREPAVPRHD